MRSGEKEMNLTWVKGHVRIKKPKFSQPIGYDIKESIILQLEVGPKKTLRFSLNAYMQGVTCISYIFLCLMYDPFLF